MEEKKKNNTALIVVIVLVCVFLFFALIGFVGYYAYKNVIEPKISDTIKEGTTTTNTKDGKDTKTTTSSKSSSSSAKDAKATDKDSPLKIGEWGLASKYVGKYLDESYTDYIDVPVRVTKVSRGDKIIDDLKKLLAEHRYKYKEPKSSQLEWAIIEYEVDLTNVKFGGTLGTTIKIDSDIKGSDGGSVKYDGISYFVSTRDMSNNDYVKEPGVYSGKFVTQLPKGCKDYLIKFGSYGKTESYFKGE